MSKQTNTKTWFLAALLAGVSVSARADTYLNCSDFHQTFGYAGTNPPVTARVTHLDYGRWTVTYYLRNGEVVFRENQLVMFDKTDHTKTQWSGWRGNKQMVGMLVSAPGDRQGVGGERSHGRLDSDRRARQSEVAKPSTLETTMQVAADRTDASTAIQTDLPAIFAFFGTQPIYLADHIFVARRRGEDVEALDSGRRCGGLARAVGPAQGESARADGAGLPHHRHPRGRIGRLLDPPRSAERRNRKPRCRCRVDFDLAPPAPSEDRRDRWGRRWSARF